MAARTLAGSAVVTLAGSAPNKEGLWPVVVEEPMGCGLQGDDGFENDPL
jgi:hypothetical protein